METEQVTHILGKASIETLRDIEQIITSASEIRSLKPPHTSLVMMGVEDSVRRTPFYLGEVFVTKCAVSVDKTIGYGYAMGDDADRAYFMAVIDAALAQDHPRMGIIQGILDREKQAQDIQETMEYAVLNKTRVRFETMEENGDDANDGP